MKAGKALTIAGIMSGTSADGIDVALVRIAPRGFGLKLRLLAHRAFPFPKTLRQAILASMDAQSIATAELARLHWRLGIAYAEAVRATIEDTHIHPDLIGCHGQTIYHQGAAAPYAGKRFACTWQLGEPALIAAELRVPVVSNFRPADMAVGGQGAPLVPLLDYMLFAHPKRARVLQNIGGIGNLTVIPAAAAQNKLIAFDTGPGNMIIDALMQKLFGKAFDRGGKTASKGEILDPVLRATLKEKFFSQQPPKSVGREQFGAPYAERFLAACRRHSRSPEDAIATATALTAESIHQAVNQWVLPLTSPSPTDFIVSGGGARNLTLLAMLRDRLVPLGCTVSTSEATIPVEAKEAAAFALLAYQTWNHRPGNIPSATGAARPVILGQIAYA
ncbi:MAG TPA: anhydro-N-acetylmuramic acid kinase [Acidobacteriaceae bacterium]|jgi:anhydro-N-acetylmuramic acid kinase|nr:anhydro-N-acetylmuramic acid kinase [Acidobacteriaceae bacterium]